MHENAGKPYQNPEKMKGTYCLVLSSCQDFCLSIGRLGKLNFYAGGYVYIGSALNSLNSRVTRHLSREKRLFWHIDYLLDSSHIGLDYIFFQNLPERNECRTARCISKIFKPNHGFGASDCSCSSHLFYFQREEQTLLFQLLVQSGYCQTTPKNWFKDYLVIRK